MNSTDIFTVGLGLNSPWFVSNVELVELSTHEKELHIYIDFERGFRFLYLNIMYLFSDEDLNLLRISYE